MKSSQLMGTAMVAAAMAACGGSPSGKAATTVSLDSGAALDFSSVNGEVRNTESKGPQCPIIPHYEAVLQVTKMSGTVTYRWERSTGDSSKVMEVKLPDAARTGTVNVPLIPDEWLHRVRGLQVTFTDKVHVLTPVDRVSQALPLAGICF
jgi:hypothetical protein